MASSAANAAVFDRWFALADNDGDGRVTGGDAVGFFTRSGLPKDALAKVWELANTARSGYLDRPAFHRAMELIALAQSGIPITKEAFDEAKARAHAGEEGFWMRCAGEGGFENKS